MNLLTVEQLRMTYADRLLFDDLDFAIHSEDKIGVIGVNGSGKSTLLKILAGRQAYDGGQITKKRDLVVEYLAQDSMYPSEMTVLDAALQGEGPALRTLRDYHDAQRALTVSPDDEQVQARFFRLSAKMDETNAWSVESEAKSILTQLGITAFDALCGPLSGGEKKRIALASALIQDAELLILDEPTNHLDPTAIEWLETYLGQYRGALLMVTHDRYFLERVTNVIVEIDQTKLYRYEANYSRWLELKAERVAEEEAKWQKHKNLMDRELAWMRQGAKARSTKQRARIERFEALSAVLGPGQQEQLQVDTVATRLGRKTLELKHVSKAYEGRDLIRDFSFLLARDDRLGLVGPNGSGKTTLLNIMAGLVSPDSGEREIGSTVKIGYFRQINLDMDPNQRVIEYILEQASSVQTGSGRISATQMLERFLFDSKLQGTQIAKLSGGERRRLHLLKVLMEQPNVLLLDEPTNDLDIMTLSVLEDYLDDFPGAVVVVSHDRYFLDRVAEHMLAFEDLEIRPFNGDFHAYMTDLHARQQALRAAASMEMKQTPGKPDTRPRKQERTRLTMAEQHDLKTIDQDLLQMEQKIEQMEEAIELASTDYVKLQALTDEQTKLNEAYDALSERWLYLHDKLEQIHQEEEDVSDR